MFSFFKWLSKKLEPDRSRHPQVWLNKAFGSKKEIAFEMQGVVRGRGYRRSQHKLLGYNYAAEDMMSLLTSRTAGFDMGVVTAAVQVNGQEGFFLPMVDFVGRPTEYEFRLFFNKLVDAVPSLQGKELVIFDSGNSYHGYIFEIISKKEWEEYLHFLRGAPFID